MDKMKHTILALLCLCLAASSLTSCLNSDGDNATYTPPTKEQRLNAMYETLGSYTGKVYYMPSMNAEKADSVDVNWMVRDSTLTISNFPLKIMAGYITDADAQKVLQNAPGVPVEYNLSLYDLTSGAASAGTYYQFYFLPKTAETNTSSTEFKHYTSFEVDGQKHSAMITFAWYVVSSGRQYFSLFAYQDKKVAANIIIKAFQLDGKSYELNQAYGMKGNKQ